MNHEVWMQEALREADLAVSENEVPVGAVIVHKDLIIARAHNLCKKTNDPTAHAELLAMRLANQTLGSLDDCTLYVTLEPCAMCAGAMIHMRLPRLVYGAFDTDRGCCGSRLDLTDHWFDHSVKTVGGILEEACKKRLSSFFSELRQK